ncbi:MAG: hypothetical protein GC152_11635 [Alphaproteobacteria bacterium]|nr:hypothetical protein [Alphaproteobacteria bacterium]
MTKDVKKEQIELLRFERKLVGLAAVLAAAGPTVASAAEKTGGDASLGAYREISDALVKLADATTAAHQAVEAAATQAGVDFMQANGLPKAPPAAEVVRSLLGIG